MDLLDWARGPLLTLALTVFVVGVAWRLWALWRLPAPHALDTRARRHFGMGAALGMALTRTVPKGGFHPSATLVTFNPYLFHIGLALIFFGYAPHIAFVHRLTGLHWPALPDWVMYLAAGVTIVSMLVALAFRITDPVLRKISRMDDWISWTVTFLPVLTGMAVVGEPSSQILARGLHTVYREPLAIHLLTVELLLIWFPFGKLMHAFLVVPSRMQLAMFFGRRGVQT
ncbi:hypothetical protein [Ottowia sp.]|uniref:hypothetical protein n=1 Tax=Ottowia sp. TaxID=1898956 RepID=UPI002629F025|nr:hypothetical protein [Ottowia sp.]